MENMSKAPEAQAMARDDSYTGKAASIVQEVEDIAILFGWSFERLYNGFWQRPRGLAAVLLDDDQIDSIDENYAIIRPKQAGGKTLKFWRVTNGY